MPRAKGADMKRMKILASVCTGVMCLALLIIGVWAAVVANFGINTKLTFSPDGVYVELSGQVYRGASYDRLTPLYDDPSFTLEKCKNYTLDEQGTQSAYSVPQWTTNEILFLPSEKVVQFRINITNKGDERITVLPSNDISIANVSVVEELSDVLAIPSGETHEYRLTVTVGTEAIKSVPLEAGLQILKTSNIENPESNFVMDTTTKTELKSINANYSNPVYGDKIIVFPSSVNGNQVLSFKKCDLGDMTSAFENLKSTTKYLIFPEGLKTLGNDVFGFSSSLVNNLKAIYLPKSLSDIGSSVFYYMSSLTSINIPATLTKLGSCNFSDCSSLLSIKLPNCVTKFSLGDSFSGCTSLASITIPSSMTDIIINVFNDCTSLTSIYMEGAAPNLGGSGVFGFSTNAPYINKGFKIYVKAEYLSTYQEKFDTMTWGFYQDKIEIYG